MILKWIFFLLLNVGECISNYGKILIENKSAEIIRVTLSPAINWNYYEHRTNETLVRNPGRITGGNIIISGHEKILYFPLLNRDSTSSSQIQQANVYDLQGNSLLMDELVLMGKKYEFNKYAPSVHALIEMNASFESSVNTNECTQTCPAGPVGPPGPSGIPGQRGEPGLDGINGIKGDTGAKGDRGVSGTKGQKGQKGQLGQKGQKGQYGQSGQKGQKGSRNYFDESRFVRKHDYHDGMIGGRHRR